MEAGRRGRRPAEIVERVWDAMSNGNEAEALWGYRAGAGPESGELPTGYRVEAVDGRVGTVLRTENIPVRAYLTVTTGPWFLGRQLSVPAGLVAEVDAKE